MSYGKNKSLFYLTQIFSRVNEQTFGSDSTLLKTKSLFLTFQMFS